MHRVKMKHAIRTRGPGITVVAFVTVIAAVATNSTCAGTKTTVCEKSGLHCGPGQICNVAQDACINIGGCGDGVVSDEKEADGSPKEVCDDGNITDGDGCSADCKSNETCGNGIRDTKIKNPESCDDGNLNGTPGDACSINCVLAACGNSIVDVNEQCDPGPADSAGCNSHLAGSLLGCQFPKCGDGYPNPAAGELCDDGMMPSPTCNSPTLCTISRCGDSFYNPLYTIPGTNRQEECDTGGDTTACNGNNNPDGTGNCAVPKCGDNYTNRMFKVPSTGKFEECDTGGMDSKTCDFDCTTPVCGDGHPNKAAGEECDDGNHDNSDDCPDGTGGSCKPAVCGDGFVRTQGSNPEECDTGGGVDSQNCNFDCTKPVCGDGHVNLQAGELCDPADNSSCPGAGGSGNTCVNSGSNKCKVCT